MGATDSMHELAHGPHRHAWPLLEGLLPLTTSSVAGDVLAGITLAALGIPEVLGYAKIAGMPLVTGLYTIVVPIAVFALFGASRHLVVGADSATAAIFAASIAGDATPGDARWLALAGLAALLCGVLLLVARVVRLGFLANFLSRTVLVGFLTGVGVQVAAGQLGEMIGVAPSGHGTVTKVVSFVHGVAHLHLATLIVSLAVIALVVGTRVVTRRVPGALVAVVGAIVASRLLGLGAHGVAVVGHVPGGLPRFGLPALDLHDARLVLASAVSMFVVILAQSSATSRAYAAKYQETFDENVDLVGLGLANVAAAFSGTFVVNGSPTKTQMVDAAGGKSQLAQLVTASVVLLVLLFLTGPIAYLPVAVLATVVFLIGVDLVDVKGMRRIFAVRRGEFVVALVTALAVVFIGVEQGIVLAIVASILDHLRHSYEPHNAVLVRTDRGRWRWAPAEAGLRTREGLVVYRFGSSLYYANARKLYTEVLGFVSNGSSVEWVCLDCVAIGDVDYTAAGALRRLDEQLASRGVRFTLCEVEAAVRAQLEAYGLGALLPKHEAPTRPIDVVRAFEHAPDEPAPDSP